MANQPIKVMLGLGEHSFSPDDINHPSVKELLGASETKWYSATCQCTEVASVDIITHKQRIFFASSPGSGTTHRETCHFFDIDHKVLPKTHAWNLAATLVGTQLPALTLDATWSGLEGVLAKVKQVNEGMTLREFVFCLWSLAGLHRQPNPNGELREWNSVADLLEACAYCATVNGYPLHNILHVVTERDRPLGAAIALQDRLDMLEASVCEGLLPRVIVVGLIKHYKASKFGCSITLRGMEVVEFHLSEALSRKLTVESGFEILGLGRYSSDQVVAVLNVERRTGVYSVTGVAILRVSSSWLPVFCQKSHGLLAYLMARQCEVICGFPEDREQLQLPVWARPNTSTGKLLPIFLEPGHEGAYWNDETKLLSICTEQI